MIDIERMTINRAIDYVITNPSISVLALIFLAFISGMLVSLYKRKKDSDKIKTNKKIMKWLIG
jgi:hypothetical protein